MNKGIIGALLVGIAAVLIGGCGGGGGNSDESRIRGRYSSLERAMERERVDEVMYLYSPNYLYDGQTYVDARNGYAEFFDEYNDINVDFSHLDVRVYGNEAVVSGHEHDEALDTFDSDLPVERDFDFTDYFRYEHGDWYFYGNQQAAPVAAKRAPARFGHGVLKGKGKEK